MRAFCLAVQQQGLAARAQAQRMEMSRCVRAWYTDEGCPLGDATAGTGGARVSAANEDGQMRCSKRRWAGWCAANRYGQVGVQQTGMGRLVCSKRGWAGWCAANWDGQVCDVVWCSNKKCLLSSTVAGAGGTGPGCNCALLVPSSWLGLIAEYAAAHIILFLISDVCRKCPFCSWSDARLSKLLRTMPFSYLMPVANALPAGSDVL